MAMPSAAEKPPGIIAAGDPSLTDNPEAERATQFLVRNTPAYRRASLALFLSGFSTFSLLYCVQPLMPIFAQDFGVSPAASSLSVTMASSLPLIILGIVLLTSGFFMAHSVASALVGKLANGTKGHASSLYLLGYYLGSSVAGSLGGHFWSADGWPAVVAFTAGMLLVSLVAALQARRIAQGG
jgi:predicted MFS family arabinose efflux permease